MTEHTPGPWAFVQEDDSSDGIITFLITVDERTDLQDIARVWGDELLECATGLDVVRGTGEANARFIAAAPDMEKALEMYIQAADTESPCVELFIWAEEAARAALAKARGE